MTPSSRGQPQDVDQQPTLKEPAHNCSKTESVLFIFLLAARPGCRVAGGERRMDKDCDCYNLKRESRREEIFLFGFAVTH